MSSSCFRVVVRASYFSGWKEILHSVLPLFQLFDVVFQKLLFFLLVEETVF